MEYKNCEQYVLNELEEIKNCNSNLEHNLKVLHGNYDALQADFDRLHKRMDRIKEILNKYGKVTYFTDNDGKNYSIKMDIHQWKKEEQRDFDKIIRFAHIKNEDGTPFDQEKSTEISEAGPETW